MIEEEENMMYIDLSSFLPTLISQSNHNDNSSNILYNSGEF